MFPSCQVEKDRMGKTGHEKTGRKTTGLLSGGARRDRTADLLHAMQALSQLSYGPVFAQRFFHTNGFYTSKPRRRISIALARPRIEP